MASAYADQPIICATRFRSLSRTSSTATGASQATVAAWLDGIAAPKGAHADRLIALAVIVQRLARTMTADAIPGWLNTAVAVLDGQWPLELIASGQYERVAGVVASFESPVFT